MTSEILDAHYDQDHAWLYLDWKGPQKLPLVQAACRHVSTFVRQFRIKKILNDNTHITATSWELVQWVAAEYLPQVGRAGLQYVAWVTSPRLDCRSHAHTLGDAAAYMPQVALFDDLASACGWLSGVGSPQRAALGQAV